MQPAPGITPGAMSRFVRDERTVTLPVFDGLAGEVGLELRPKCGR